MNAFLYDVVAEAVQRQPWYRKNANTIVAGLTLLATAMSFVIALQLNLPTAVALALPVAVQTVGTFATKLTTNGVQLSMVDTLAATPTAAKVEPASPFLPTPEVIAAEIDRARATVQGHIDEHAPSIVAEINRIRGLPSPEPDVYTGQHRAGE